MDGSRSARNTVKAAFPVGFLRAGVVIAGLILLYGALAQRTADAALPRAGCLVTLAAAMFEWRILTWRIEVEAAARNLDEAKSADRQALNLHRTQVARVAPWAHALFFVGTLCWGFGDLLW